MSKETSTVEEKLQFLKDSGLDIGVTILYYPCSEKAEGLGPFKIKKINSTTGMVTFHNHGGHYNPFKLKICK